MAGEDLEVIYCGGKLDTEKSAEQFVKKAVVQVGRSFETKSSKQVSSFLDMKYPSSCSLVQRPDVCVEIKINDICLPILLVEVHSFGGNQETSYNNSVTKLVLSLIEQFQILTNYYEASSDLKLTGFVFPSTSSQFVTKVTLCLWNEERIHEEGNEKSFVFTFNVVEKRLTRDEVKPSVVEAIEYIDGLKLHSNLPLHKYEMCYLKLSEQHIKAIEHYVDEKGLIQVPTRSSILLKNEKVYMKVYPQQLSGHLMSLLIQPMTMSLKGNSPLLIPKMAIPKMISGIFIFPVVRYQPLSPDEARMCLAELVGKMVHVLSTIHRFPYSLAHLDVRLPNICFHENGEPVLVDIDRISESKGPADLLSSMYEGELYEAKEGWYMYNIDWKQFGYMILGILDEADAKREDDFISTLINEGKYVKEKQSSSVIFTDKKYQQKTILDVLNEY